MNFNLFHCGFIFCVEGGGGEHCVALPQGGHGANHRKSWSHKVALCVSCLLVCSEPDLLGFRSLQCSTKMHFDFGIVTHFGQEGD